MSTGKVIPFGLKNFLLLITYLFLLPFQHDRNVASSGVLGPEAKALFHTRFHAVPKLEAANPSVIKW